MARANSAPEFSLFVTGAPPTPRIIETGNNFNFIAADVIDVLDGQQLTAVVTRDKSDRRFVSREGSFRKALEAAIAMMHHFQLQHALQ